MSVTSPGRPGRPTDPVVFTLVLAVAALLGVLATTSPAWAIGITVALAAVPVIHHLATSSSDDS